MTQAGVLLIENRSAIPDSVLQEIWRAAQVPRGAILAVVGTDDVTSESTLAECRPRELVHLRGRTILRLRARQRSDWDCGIALTHRLCTYSGTNPPYFAHVFAHELSHAIVCLTEPRVHRLANMLEVAAPKALGRPVFWHELPHERAHDDFATAVVEDLYGRPALADGLAQLVATEQRKDEKRIMQILARPGSRDLSGLEGALVAWAEPYRDRFLSIWREQAEWCHASGEPFIGDDIDWHTLLDRPVTDYRAPTEGKGRATGGSGIS